jgi:hypothetical protein
VGEVQDLIRGWRLCLLAAALLISTMGVGTTAASSQADSDCVALATGDLAAEIRSITEQMPGPGSNGMVVPTPAQMAAWEQMIKAVDEGSLATACSLIEANGFPYRLVRFTDNGGKAYLLLEENAPVSVGWGTYAINPDSLARDLVIELPHAGFESRTEEEGTQAFRELNARALLMAGAHRCANMAYSPCAGTTTVCGQSEPHRTSDVAHVTQTIFHAAHRALVEPGKRTVAVQFHGCTGTDCADVFISNTTCTPGELTKRFYTNVSAACPAFSVDIADCVEPECPLVGRTNVQGRYSNGIFWSRDYDPCTTSPSGPANPDQFLHLEQSPGFRQDYDCLLAALKTTFPLSQGADRAWDIDLPLVVASGTSGALPRVSDQNLPHYTPD